MQPLLYSALPRLNQSTVMGATGGRYSPPRIGSTVPLPWPSWTGFPFSHFSSFFFSFFIPLSFRRLYYLDPQYEKVVRVDLPNGDNPKTLLDNEVKLRTLNIYRKRPLRSNHPCLTNQGGCDHICIPAADNQRTCGCSVGFQKRANDDTSCLPYSSYAIVSQLSLARGFSLKDQGEAMMPISGKGGTDLLYPFYILRD